VYIKHNKHLFPLIDQLIEEASEDLAKQGTPVTCRDGCAYCCHLLIEITWEEAMELAHWILDQPDEIKQKFIKNVKDNAAKARKLFLRNKKTAFVAEPIKDKKTIPAKIFDVYFYKLQEPCPMLDNNRCGAYEHRPIPCRMHVATSPNILCSYLINHDEIEEEIPKEIEDIQDDVGDVISHLHKDERWGHFGIMVEAALNELINITHQENI